MFITLLYDNKELFDFKYDLRKFFEKYFDFGIYIAIEFEVMNENYLNYIKYHFNFKL